MNIFIKDKMKFCVGELFVDLKQKTNSAYFWGHIGQNI